MAGLTITLEHNGKKYAGEVMRIKSTMLGYQDHGILTAMLFCEGAGSGVGVGGYALDSYSSDDKRRIGTAYGTEHITAIMETVGVSSWEKLVGKDILTLFPNPGTSNWGQSVQGIASLDGKRVLIFEEHVEEWKARAARVRADAEAVAS